MSSIFWRQVLLLTKANLKSRYRKTFAGFIWVILNPLVMYLAQSLVFKYFLKISTPNYFLFLGSGLLPWIFVHQSLDMTATIFQTNGTLIKSFSVNPLVYLYAQLLDNFVNFIAAMVLVLVPLVIAHQCHPLGVLLLPIPLINLILTTIGMTWIIATLQVFLRDTKFVLSFVMSVSYFVTPIFYPIEFVPESLRWLVYWNPFYIMVSPIRAALYDFNLMAFVGRLVPACILTILTLTTAFYYWKAKKNELLFNI